MSTPRRLAALAILAAALPAAAEAFSPGEESVFQLRYLDVPSGEARLSVGTPAGDVWPVIFQARTGGLAGFFDVREHLVSYWDAPRRQSRGFDLRAFEVGDYHEDRARFDRANGRATFERTRKGTRTSGVHEVPADVSDLTGAIMWLRLQPLRPGDRHEVPVLTGTRQFVLVAEVQGAEQVTTPAGTFQAVKVRVRTALGGHFSTKRDTSVWLSDDARHVIVRIELDLSLGAIVATLRSYRPGVGQVASR